jgi:murein DD-endopeptidase MepM/ murein hydrolase activator NlpD
MKTRKHLAVLSCFALISTLNAQSSGFGSTGHYEPAPAECLTQEKRIEIQGLISQNRQLLYAQGKLAMPNTAQLVSFAWPLRLRTGLVDYGYHSVSGFVDNNGSFPNQLSDYNCGTQTYDTPSGYNHAGTDYYLWPFSWNKMDSSDVEIIAAAAGTIVYKNDGEFDRSCTSNGNNWNAVYVQHTDGSTAWYGHMKNGSLTNKTVGMTVAQGEYLGVVGSSGNSTGPHLHFEIYDVNNTLIDPYVGACNPTTSVSWWASQRPYIDRGINHIASNSTPPVFNACSNQDVKNEEDYFLPTDTIFLMTYYRFLQNADNVQINIYMPNNQLWSSWQWTNTWGSFTSAWVYWWMIPGVGAMNGQWRFEAVYDNQTYSDTFWVLNNSSMAEGFVQTETGDEYLIYDATGKLVKVVLAQAVSENKITEGLPPGVYCWRLMKEGNSIREGKIVQIERE